MKSSMRGGAVLVAVVVVMLVAFHGASFGVAGANAGPVDRAERDTVERGAQPQATDRNQPDAGDYRPPEPDPDPPISAVPDEGPDPRELERLKCEYHCSLYPTDSACSSALRLPTVAPIVKTPPSVPDNVLIPHSSWSGKVVRLKGTSSVSGAGIEYSWDPGDGSPAITGTVTNPYVIEATHVYVGLPGDTFTATLTVTDTGTGESGSAPFRVEIQDQALPAEVNAAIDDGLWYLHKTQQRYTSGGIDYGHWLSGGNAAGGSYSISASNILAFEVGGHLEIGNSSNPYVETVERGLHQMFVWLRTSGIGNQTNGLGTFNPDSSIPPNGLGIRLNQGNELYQGGMIMDAIAATGTPNTLTVTGSGGIVGRSYADILQDMVDYYAYCQYDGGQGGGWRYSCNSFPDNSANQWAAIGMIPAERVFGLTVPQIVKDWNRVWINYSQGGSGACGYTGTGTVWGPYAVTPSCMVQMAMDGIGRGDSRWDNAETYLRDRFGNTGGAGSAIRDYYYGLFSLTKSMLLHDADGDGQAESLDLLQSQSAGVPPLNWYAAETPGDPIDGVARTLVNDQHSSGYWRGHNFNSQQYPFETAWAVVMLRKTVFERPPVAVVFAVPNPGEAGIDITLDCSDSFHLNPDREIVAWDWDFDGDGCDDASGPVVETSFPLLGVYPVTCCVTDGGDEFGEGILTDDATVDVLVTIPPIAPTAEGGGPYILCPDDQPWFLDGTGSVNPDDGVSEPGEPADFITEYAWDLDEDNNADVFGAQPDVTGFFTAAGPGDYLVSLTVTDNSALSFPFAVSEGVIAGDLSDTDSAEVRVREATDEECLDCDASPILVTATEAACGTIEIQVSWTDVGAAGYRVYRSTVPGGPYTLVASTAGTAFLDTDVVADVTYYYVVWSTQLNGDEICRSDNEASATPCDNTAPTAEDDSATTILEVGVNTSVLANDSDPEGDPLAVDSWTNGANGVVSCSATVCTYTPVLNFIGGDSYTYTVCDDGTPPLCDTATVWVTVNPAPKMESNTVTADGTPSTINLVNTYIDPVVVATVQYANNMSPVVTRVSNVTPTSFNLRLQNPGGGNPVLADDVHYWVVESGVWIFDGVKIEARKYLSTTTNRKGAWLGADAQTYGQVYVSPVVFAQVMTENDPRWSSAFARGSNHFQPPNATNLQTGKHVGEDTAHARANETLGYIVVDAVHTVIAGVEFEAALGLDTVTGVVNGAPHQYTFNNPFGLAPQCVVTTSAGLDGADGSWTQVHGPTVATTTQLNLSVDEDQIGDAERSHTTEQVSYAAFAGPMVYPRRPDCVDDVECDDGLFCNGQETCTDSRCVLGDDPCPNLTCDEALDVCGAGVSPKMESVSATAGGRASTTVPLVNNYVSPVIACTVVYANNTVPVVPRIDNVTSTSFEVYLQNPGDLAAVVADTVQCLVVEEGSWMMDGHPVEAAKYDSTITDKEYNWLGAFQTLTHSYTNPVILGQVMSSNDDRWSYYWQQGSARSTPPTGIALRNGKTVAEDPDVVRATETVGYIVFEQSNGTLGGVTFEAALGLDIVQGIDNLPPDIYAFNVPFTAPPQHVVATQAGMDGSDGSWAYLYDTAFSTATTLSLAVDEDQIFNAERGHTTEQVGYVAFETPVLYPQQGCAVDAECDDGNYCNGSETCNVGTSTCQAGSNVVCDDGVGCTDDACNEATDSCDFAPNNGNCDNGLFCDGAETCDPAADCLPGSDPCGGGVCDEASDTCPGAGPVFLAEWGTVGADSTDWVTVNLTNGYVDPVVVTSIEYANNAIPMVTRIQNVGGGSFQVRLQNPSGSALVAETIGYLVVEKGTWNIGGVKIEAQKYLSSKTAHDGDWNQYDVQAYGQGYTNPAVLGQVMTFNDPNFSAFWSRGPSRGAPPTATDLRTGKTVAEDPNTVRADETIGFVVVEGGHGFLGGAEYECKLGTDSVASVVNLPPYPYTFSTSFSSAPDVAVTTQSAMDGFNGGWMYTYGPGAASATTLNMAGDEDQLFDAERSRATESAAYCVFQTAGAFP